MKSQILKLLKEYKRIRKNNPNCKSLIRISKEKRDKLLDNLIKRYNHV